MGRYAFLILFTALFYLLSCGKNDSEILESRQNHFFEYDREFDLQAGDIAISSDGKVKVGFENVLEDSRCPSDVECVWAGQVKVQIGFFTDGKDSLKQVIILEGKALAEPWLLEGYSVKLISVEPYPISTKQIRLEDYKITLLVTKN